MNRSPEYRASLLAWLLVDGALFIVAAVELAKGLSVR